MRKRSTFVIVLAIIIDISIKKNQIHSLLRNCDNRKRQSAQAHFQEFYIYIYVHKKQLFNYIY